MIRRSPDNTWYTFRMEPSIDSVRLDKTAFRVFSSFAEAEAADRAYWHSRTPEERLLAVELMRQSAYGYDQATARLQRVLEITQLKRG
jgi:hypothetical protein